MKLKIYEEEKAEEGLKWSLKLSKDNNGRIGLIAIDDDTGCHVYKGVILFFNERNELILCNNLNPDLGLPLASNGSIIMDYNGL